MLELDVGRFQIESSSVHSLIPESDREALGSDRIRNMELMKMRTRTNIDRSGPNLQGLGKAGNYSVVQSSPVSASNAPPTTPALLLKNQEQIARKDYDVSNDEDHIPLSVSVVKSPIPKPLPPIGRSSTRSSLTSGSPSKVNSPRSFVLTPARSMPDMLNAALAQGISPPTSARKDMATSPASNS